jgi:hypothetical protein
MFLTTGLLLELEALLLVNAKETSEQDQTHVPVLLMLFMTQEKTVNALRLQLMTTGLLVEQLHVFVQELEEPTMQEFVNVMLLITLLLMDFKLTASAMTLIIGFQMELQDAFVMNLMDGSMTQIHLTVSNYLAPFLENKLEKNVGPQIPLMQQLL